MADFPQYAVPPLFINSYSRYFPIVENGNAAAPTAALQWGAANRALYMPFMLPFSYPVRRVFWATGTSVASTNFDLGIYTFSGTKIYSTGSVAGSGTSVLQYTTPTEFLLSPGSYYLAMACSTTTSGRGGTGIAAPAVARLAIAGYLVEASALPLPDTMTPVTMASSPVPICGFTRTSTGF